MVTEKTLESASAYLENIDGQLQERLLAPKTDHHTSSSPTSEKAGEH
jgi:hypothetical protein